MDNNVKKLWQQLNNMETIIIHRHHEARSDAIGSQGWVSRTLKSRLSTRKKYLSKVGGPVEGLGF